MANIKVAVRVRPISVRELNLTGSEVVVRTDSSGISLTNLKVSSSKAGDSRERTRRYGFDYCFDSSDPQAENFATQARIYETLGQPVLDTVFDGYNSCLVAYGQSASGKTYTMMGTKEDPGLTPRLCNGLFARVEEEEKKGKTYRVSVREELWTRACLVRAIGMAGKHRVIPAVRSVYLEIYNERVRDLLKPSTSPGGLRVREHPRLGPYVQGLTRHVVPTLGSLMSYVEEGTRARKTASTLQNPNSSRSHALLTVSISPESSSPGYSGVSSTSSSSTARRCEKPTARAGSKLHLVDLAGSESAATCGGVHRLKEGANINKSLVALGNVISALAERGSTGSGPGRRFIPYRDSSLTWLLKDALGGNATTIMLATISPASGSYNETAHTLRFAQRAQSVVNRPVVNEDPVARIIRELREEVARLKSLLLEKDAQSDTRLLCCCKESQSTDSPVKNLRETEEYSEAKGKGLKVEKTSNTSVRRSNSSEGLTAHEIDSPGPVKRYSSYEYLPLRDRFVGNYNRAKVTELNEEEDEVNESVFVDIPTLVAVLIKPDESLQEASTQIEEICSDDVAEDSIDADFLESGNDQEGFEDTEKPESIDHDERSSSVNSCHAPGDAEVGDFCRNSTEYLAGGSSDSISKARERNKVRKQDSIDVVVQTIPSNLHTSKKFGSEEIIQKKKEPLFALERSHTNLEKRAGISERVKRLNNIREIDDQKTGGRIGCVWRTAGSKEHLQRKGSNDSDKSIKESGSNSGTRTKNYARKPSLENLKRKTSKDSSSSSSKEEQILISNLARDKLLRRKSSLEQEPPSVRAHTPIQRVKRAEIVAAVTERLYSSRKHSEENSASASAAGIRSPPEGTDVKSGSSVFPPKMKLQELSRKMLAKRRRVSTDTQTDFSRTIRMKDTASLTEEPKIECRDAAVLTDNHTSCNFLGDDRVPTLRVKEIATLTDKPKTHIVKCKDVACLANDLDEYEYEIHSLRNDSGILSDDTQNYAESNVSSAEASDLCPVSERRVVYTESSMNTVFTSPYRDSACQFPLRGVTSISTQNIVELPVQQHSMINIDAQRQEVAPSQPQHIASIPNHQYRGIASQHPEQSKTPSCTRPCCNISREPGQALSETNPDKNVISISLTDMISITVESTNILDSRIAVMEGLDVSDEKMKNSTTDSECQTDQNSEIAREAEKSRFSFKDFTRSTLSQTDGRVFRIENIFQDPNNMSRPRSKIDVGLGSADNTIQNSVIFTNSLGTSYASHVKETTGDRKIQGWDRSGEGRGSFVQDGLITEAFITKKRSSTLSPGCLPLASNSPWRNLTVPRPINSACCVGHGDNHDPPWWQLQNVPVNGLILPCKNCAPPLLPGDRQKLGQSQPGPNLINVKEAPGLNSTPSFGRLDEPDHEHNFSDDSLDYTVNDNMLKEPKNVRLGKEKCESRETLCPPDVVAHTKKENQKSTSHADKEVSFDFEESHVEFPKKKPGETMVDGQAPIHDYKSLILGNPVYNQYDSVPDEESDSTAISNRPRSVGKKKVSFFGCTSPRRRNDGKDVKPAKSGSMLKSIIKKKKVDIVESVEISSNEETDDSVRQGAAKVTSVGEGGHPRSRSKLSSSEESSGSRENLEPGNVPASLKGSARRGVKFSGRDFSEDSCTESSSCSDADSEEGIPSKRCTRNILEEYLDEAVIFMRNMNSINEYMSATRMFEKYIGRGSKRRGGRRRVRPFCEQDYVEFQGRRVSLEDDTDKYLRVEDDDAVVSTEPYDRCLKGIKRLENCIQRADKHDEILREKYSLDWESAGARLSLASPCIDPSLAGRGTESATANSEDLIQDTNAYSPSIGPSTETGVMEQSADDLEKRIFDQLMNVVDSSRCRTTRRLLPPATYSKSRSFSRHVPVEPLTGNEDARTHLTESSPEEEDSSAPINRAARLTTVGIARETLDTGENVFVRARTSTDERLGSPMRTEIPREPGIKHEQDSSEKVGPKNRAHFPRQRIISRNTRERDTEECSRRIRDGVSETRTSPLARSEASDLETSSDPITADSIDGIAHFRDKLKYPGSPRARFLELLRERRRIVESSRGTSAS